jgi:outer membrane protein OmpA-like peptidoglycan-associated protein
MYFRRFYIIFILCFTSHYHYAQTDTGKLYKIDRYESIYLPLGKISFADSLISYKVGSPTPIEKYRDSTQCLGEPNYKKYSIPNFTSLGCGGALTVEFTDNGFMNLKGKDLYIFEVGPSRETAKIEISQNGIDWVYAGKISGGKSSVELSEANIDTETVYHYVRVTDLKSLCKSKSAGADIDAIGAINSVIKLTIDADVLFDIASFELKESSQQTLDSLVSTIKKVNKATILIDGHTDSDGTEGYNLDLAQQRCESVAKKLKSLFGINARYDYEIKSYGESKPRVPNTNAVNKQLNRRVEITVVPPRDYYESLPAKD